MKDKSEKRARRLFFSIVVIIFILFFILSSPNVYSQINLPNPEESMQHEQDTEEVLSPEPVTEEQVNDSNLSQEESLLLPVELSAEKIDEAEVIQDETEVIKDETEDKAGEIGSSEKEAAIQPKYAAEPYTLGKAYNRNLRVNVVVSNNGEMASSNIRLEVPLLGALDSPYQVISREYFSHEPVEVKALEFSSCTAIFRFDSLPPGGSETITLNYFLKVYPIKVNTSHISYNTVPVYSGYLAPSPNIESDHPEIIKKAQQVTAPNYSDLEKARAIYKFVIDYMHYNLNASSRNSSALTALRSGSGVCEDYAALFTALCRASGVPARIVYGYTDPRGTGELWNIESGNTFSLRGYRHSWAEFYVDGTGWIPVDPTMNIHSSDLKYFASLPHASHIAQNYENWSIKASFQGGQLSVTWEEELASRH